MAEGDTLARAWFAKPDIERVAFRDGFVLRSRAAPRAGPPSVMHYLAGWAERAPERVFLAERAPDQSWRKLSYRAALDSARAIGASLLTRGLGPERPLAVLSDNSIDQALMLLGAMYVGVPAATVSPAYSLVSNDFDKLKSIIAQLAPGLVYAADGARYAAALGALTVPHVVVSAAADGQQERFETLMEGDAPSADAAFAALGPDTVARILFTSGSTGTPKGVVTTHRMLVSNQEALAQLWPFLEGEAPVLLDWLPWSHTFGANNNFNLVMRNGGSLYIDAGRPAPGLFDHTLANLRQIAPTLYLNVPRGFDMLLPHLEQSAALRERFFSRLKVMLYAGAALPRNAWDRLRRLAIEHTGAEPVMLSAWGTTETAPMATIVHYRIEAPGNVGVPIPGVELFFRPAGDKWEVRVRGANVTPGYWRDPAQSARAFDEDGFFVSGDAAKLADEADPSAGILFDGRIAENFKLASGTWVFVGARRLEAIEAMAPVVQDAVVAGHDRDCVGLLLFPNLAACRALCPQCAHADAATLLAQQAIRDVIARGLAAIAAKAGGSSRYAARALLMHEPPSIDQGEITDKGYINQRAVLRRRASLVEELYDDASSGVIRLAG